MSVRDVTAEIEAAANAGAHTMSLFKVKLTVTNPKREELTSEPIDALVDSGSELTWVPGDVLRSVGITPRRRMNFHTATKQAITREVGYAIVRAEGFETNDVVVFGESGDMILLGVHTLEGFSVSVDPIAHRFIPVTSIVASLPPAQ
jgi:predicted aspartyl protease